MNSLSRTKILSYEETIELEEKLNERLDKAQKMIINGLHEVNEVMWEMQKITQPAMRAYYGLDNSSEETKNE